MTTEVGGGARKGQNGHRTKKNGHAETPAQEGHARVPPHSLEAERSLLGGVLLDRDVPVKDLFNACPAGDFYRDAHRKIAEAIIALAEDALPVDRISVADRLTESGRLEDVGGHEYLERLENDIPVAANLAYYAKIVHDKARARRMIEAASSIAMLGYEQYDDVADFVKEADKRLHAVIDGDAAKAPPLPERAIKISRELLTTAPPARRFMLLDDKRRGIYLRGKVGLFAAAGGTGKSSVFGQLAIALATGLTWFGEGGWEPAEQMRVLLLAGEDDREELERRLFFSVRDIGASSDRSFDLVRHNVVAVPLAGSGCALTNDDSFAKAAGLPETAFAVGLRDYVRSEATAGRPFGLILIDPMSRFAGFDVEKDNAAATRWVQVVETLTTPECGSPSVLVAHHTKKRGADDRKSDAVDLIRGASALKDGVRWAGVLEQQKRTKGVPDLLTLRIVKANAVPPQLAPLILCRPNAGNEGSLRIATPEEIAAHETVANLVKDKAQQVKDYQTRVLEKVEAGQFYLRDDIVLKVGGNRQLVLAAVRQLVLDKELAESRRGRKTYVCLNRQLEVPTSSADPGTSRSAAQPSGSGPAHSTLLPFRAEGEREPRNPGAATGSFEKEKAPPSASGSRGSREPEQPPPHNDEDAPA